MDKAAHPPYPAVSPPIIPPTSAPTQGGTWGALLVFNRKLFEAIENSYWKGSELDRRLFPGKSALIFDRWGRGLGALIFGFGMLTIFAGTIWQPIFTTINWVFLPSQLFDTIYVRVIMAVLLLIAGYELLRMHHGVSPIMKRNRGLVQDALNYTLL